MKKVIKINKEIFEYYCDECNEEVKEKDVCCLCNKNLCDCCRINLDYSFYEVVPKREWAKCDDRKEEHIYCKECYKKRKGKIKELKKMLTFLAKDNEKKWDKFYKKGKKER